MAYRLRSSITRPLTPNIGIDPDFRVYVSDRLLEIHDGPFLELGPKGIVGQVIELPRRLEDRPDRDQLALRFEEFKKAA